MSHQDRIVSIDIVRGVGILTILLYNIVGMGLHLSAYDNPRVAGGANGINRWVWAALNVFGEGTTRGLITLVFGASLVLMTQRLERGERAADVFYRRLLWLFLLGIVHAFFLYRGDILHNYALCGLIIYPFRKLSGRALLGIGIFVALMQCAANVVPALTLGSDSSQSADAKRHDKSTPVSQADKEWARPSSEELDADSAAWRGGFVAVTGARIRDVYELDNAPFYAPQSANWDIWDMLFLGMALGKLGALRDARAGRRGALMATLGYGIGVPLQVHATRFILQHDFAPPSQWFVDGTSELARVAMTFGHLGIVLLLVHVAGSTWFGSSLRAIGETALSNYVFQSIVGAFVFTGYGFGLYGTLSRYQLYYFVLGIWLVQLVGSPLWLRRYRFGPLEWCWRSLTYWNRLPFLRATAAEA